MDFDLGKVLRFIAHHNVVLLRAAVPKFAEGLAAQVDLIQTLFSSKPLLIALRDSEDFRTLGDKQRSAFSPQIEVFRLVKHGLTQVQTSTFDNASQFLP